MRPNSRPILKILKPLPLLSLGVFLSIFGFVPLLSPPIARAGIRDNAAEARKRAQMATVKRVVVIPPFFGTETLKTPGKPDDKPGESNQETNETTEEAKKEAKEEAKNGSNRDEKHAVPVDPNSKRYREYLKKLEEHAQSYLPERLTKRAKFMIVPAIEVTTALKKLNLTPEKMFENGGMMKGTKFPMPRPEAIRNLCDALKADAIVLGVLDEPRRANGKYFYDALYGFSYEPSNVEAHAGFYLMLSEGTELLHGYMRVRSPISRANNGRDFVLPDWIDVQELMIENLMDEWTYYIRK